MQSFIISGLPNKQCQTAGTLQGEEKKKKEEMEHEEKEEKGRGGSTGT